MFEKNKTPFCKMNKVCIVIPIYKDSPTEWEKASFCQALKVLTRYEMVIYTHKELNLKVYHNLARQYNKDFKVEYFDKEYFSSVVGYNRLCLTVDFYERVSNYDYMLIYQLDAWVFRDELEYWCNKGYDYIGAPWFANWGTYEEGNELWAVGNGGFSLRRIDYVVRLLSYKWPVSFRLNFNKGLIGFLKSFAKSIGVHNTVNYIINKEFDVINEDWILTNYFKNISSKSIFHPNLPTIETALKFAFECSPSYCYRKCGNKLPFGCHAFEKYEYETFWKKHIIL